MTETQELERVNLIDSDRECLDNRFKGEIWQTLMINCEISKGIPCKFYCEKLCQRGSSLLNAFVTLRWSDYVKGN